MKNPATLCFFLGLCCLTCITLNAQIKTSVSFSNPYLKQAKSAYQTQKEYKKYLKDSVKRIKRLNKYFDSKIDSLSRQIEHEAIDYAGVPLPEVSTTDLKGFKLDSALNRQFNYYEGRYLGKPSIDSTYSVEVTELDSVQLQQLKIKHDSLEGFDQVLLAQLESNLVQSTGLDQLVPNRPMNQTASLKQLDQFKNPLNGYRDKKNLKSNLNQLSSSKLITQNKKLNEAHRSLTNLKKKYVTLPSVKDLSTGVKRGSLKGLEFKKRLIWGGSIKITQTKGVDIDFSPSVAYLITKRLSTGIEVIYRGKFGDGNNWHEAFNSKTYGGRIFTDYKVVKSFYAHAEFESIRTPTVPIPQQDTNANQTVLGAMAGLGKRFNMGKAVIGKVIAQYNFLHQEDVLYSSPWVIRFGFEIKKKKK